MKRYSFLIFILILTIGCRPKALQQETDGTAPTSDSDTSDCAYGAPQPTFNPNTPGVLEHSFEGNRTEATERVKLQSGIVLTLFQTGCNDIRQEFRFELAGNYQGQPVDFWVDETIRLLRSLSALGPDYSLFSPWADQIETRKTAFRLAESVELLQGFYAAIDRIEAPDNAILLLTLSDHP